MQKGMIIGLVAAGAVIVIGGAVYFTTQNKSTDTNGSASQQSSKEVQIVDPEGVYKPFSDPSVIKHPDEDFVFGAGKPFVIEYDGTKTEKDPYATLSYQLYYIQDSGTVVNFTGGNLEGTDGIGAFKTDAKVFTSDADGRKGFVEVTVTYKASFDAVAQKYTGTTHKLGMYPVTFKVSE